MQGAHTPTHTHAHASHTPSHTAWPACVQGLDPPGSTQGLLARAQAQGGGRPSSPHGGQSLAGVNQGQAMDGFLEGSPTLPGGCSLLLTTCTARPPTEHGSGKDGHISGFQLPEEAASRHWASGLGIGTSPGVATATAMGAPFLTRTLSTRIAPHPESTLHMERLASPDSERSLLPRPPGGLVQQGSGPWEQLRGLEVPGSEAGPQCPWQLVA